jgi:hypothetical protein
MNVKMISTLTDAAAEALVDGLERAWAAGQTPRVEEDLAELKNADHHAQYVRALKIAYRYGLIPTYSAALPGLYRGEYDALAIHDAFEAGLVPDRTMFGDHDGYTKTSLSVLAAAYKAGLQPDMALDVFGRNWRHDCVAQVAFLAVSYGAKATFDDVVRTKSLDVLIAAYEKKSLVPQESHIPFIYSVMMKRYGVGESDSDAEWDPDIDKRAAVGEAFVAAYSNGLNASYDHAESLPLIRTQSWTKAYASAEDAREGIRARMLEAAYAFGGLIPERRHITGGETKAVVQAAFQRRTVLFSCFGKDLGTIVYVKSASLLLRPARTTLDVRLYSPSGLDELGFPEGSHRQIWYDLDKFIEYKRACAVAGADMKDCCWDKPEIARRFILNLPPFFQRFDFELRGYPDSDRIIRARHSLRLAQKILAGMPEDIVNKVAEWDRHMCVSVFVRACVLESIGIPGRMALSDVAKDGIVPQHVLSDGPWLERCKRLHEACVSCGFPSQQSWYDLHTMANDSLAVGKLKGTKILPKAGVKAGRYGGNDDVYIFDKASFEAARALASISAQKLAGVDSSVALKVAAKYKVRKYFVPVKSFVARALLADTILRHVPDASKEVLKHYAARSMAPVHVRAALEVAALTGATASDVLWQFRFRPRRLELVVKTFSDRCAFDAFVKNGGAGENQELRHAVTACLRSMHPGSDVNMFSGRFHVAA